MTQYPPSRDEERLAQWLRREARASEPVFSEALHARMMAALRSQRPGVRRRGHKTAWLAAGLAAGLAVGGLVAATLLWRPRPQPVPAAPALRVASAVRSAPLTGLDVVTRVPEDTAEDFGRLLDAAIAPRRWAYLDHDARVATQLLLDQLPMSMLARQDEPVRPEEL